VLDRIDPYYLKAIRQLLTFFAKSKALPDPRICRKAFLEYRSDDDEIRQQSLWSTSIATCGYTPGVADQHGFVDSYFRSLGTVGRLFSQCARAIGFESDRHYDSLISDWRMGLNDAGYLEPKHGPGAVSERLDDDAKWKYISTNSSRRLDGVFPTHWALEPRDWDQLTETADQLDQADRPSRLIAVPKTAKTPRLIASEPVANQFWQQALMRALKQSFDRTWVGDSINISDQSVSQERAKLGSTDRSLGTIDLSKASDTVTLDHVGALFPTGSNLLHALMTCRTESVQIPEIGEIRLKKFASMGSAVCFPIESMVFLAATAASILHQLDLPFTSGRMKAICRDVTVYGDDIIAPTHHIPGILRDLRVLGFIPNESKSFYRSYFRESCGADYYQGYSVKPVYLRQDIWTRKKLQDTDVVSIVETSRQAFDAGLHRVAEQLASLAEARLSNGLPFSEEPVGYLAHNIPWRLSRSKLRINSKLHRLEHQVYMPVAKKENTTLDGYARLLRYFVRSATKLELSLDDYAEIDWTKMSTRGFKLKPRWIEA
jgi:hypothetical protein